MNPNKYKIWKTMQKRSEKDRDISQLKWLIEVLHGLQQTVIDEAVSEWQKCLRTCVFFTRDERFEHLLI